MEVTQRIKTRLKEVQDWNSVIDEIEHRFLLFTDELIPLLVEASNSRNQSIKKSV